ncbi:MAG: efflux RND transporter periplasmic adaptor subunit [Alloprevotella sp.]|nr:efflux RND transporter periplasmic adaptor subunit [Alloprevotella sp.]
MKRIVVLSLVLASLVSCGKKQQGLPPADDRYAVITVQPQQAQLNVTYPASIKGVQDVEIRPKISGFITSIRVKEGQMVSKGQVLFQIDNAQYLAAVKAARAQIDVVRANISTQELTVENKKLLRSKDIISDYDLQLAENNLKSLKAQLASAQAQLASAQDNLNWCTVTSPASGVIGMIPLKVGALVGPSMQEPFTTVSDMSSVNAYFSMTEKQLLELARTGNGGVQEALRQMPSIRLVLADGTLYGEEGKIDAVGGVIDQTTGAVQMRATFANPHRILRSGGSANVQFPVFSANAILIPQAATVEIQDKKFVYVVGKDNKVISTEITVESQNDGSNYVVTSGLKAGDRIVVEGVQSLKNEQEIKPITPEESAKMREDAKQAIKDGKLPF